MKLTHEDKVEFFYSHGSATRGLEAGGYLSFGYWINEIIDYPHAVETLIDRVLQFEKPLNCGTILNVACGYGAETVRIYEKLCPDKIIAIDITDAHIQFAKQQMALLRLSDKIQFEKLDACKLDFPANSFAYVIGIEGPAHFDTREAFLRKAYTMLKPDGILLLSDIIVDSRVVAQGLFNRFISNLCAKHWYMPRANWMSIEEMKVLLVKIGFTIDTAESVGHHVYPGFARYNLKWESIRNAVRTRGLRIGLALTFISWLLGYVYKRKMTDYVFLRAIKK